MARRKKSLNPLQHLSRFFTLLVTFLGRAINFLTRGLLKTIRRSLPQPRRNRRRAATGFVLPTIVMVSLVVVLVTTAVMIRSFDRSKNASNFRANEAILNAATPALDRSRAKITRLFSGDETNLPVGTPNDNDIEKTLISNIGNYTFGDEENLVVSLAGQTDLKTAWRYPVDTNNNGKFDSFTIYGIYFRSPLDANGQPTTRSALDARSNPMEDGQSSSCNAGSTQVGSWVKTGSGALKKAFFTYVATVPISAEQAAALDSKYEEFVGNQSFSALEMQQDQVRLSLDNNAIFYQDDLEITFAPQFFVNGRVHSNSNLLVSAFSPDQKLVFLQVSSPFSCFYQPENSVISIGGNVAAGGIFEKTDGQADLVQVHLFRGKQNDPTVSDNTGGRIPEKNPTTPSISAANKTTEKAGGREVAYNDRAYQERLRVLTSGALNLFDTDPLNWEKATPTLVDAVTRFPQDVKDTFRQKYNEKVLQPTLLRNVLQTYFEERIRRVPFAEVSINTPNDDVKVGAIIASENPTESRAGRQYVFSLSADVGGVITPPRNWMLIEAPNGSDVTAYTKLPLKYLPATDPQRVNPLTKQNDYIGDRVIVGNSLPYKWFNANSSKVLATEPNKFAKANAERPVLPPTNWLQPADPNNPDTPGGTSGSRNRNSRIVILDDIADTSRGGFWETAAATNQAKVQIRDTDGTLRDDFISDDVRGGLRVITGAGIYIDGCPTDGTFPAGFPCDSKKGLGLRSSDPQATLLTTRSFLPKPPQFLEDTTAGDYRLPLSPPYPTPVPSPAPTAPAGEEQVRVKLPGDPILTGEKPITVWPDTMPMWEDRNLDGKWDIAGWNASGLTEATIKGLDLKGDLQMRSSVVYHYKSSTPEIPIACVASYYDPSNTNSANASDGLPLTTDRRTNGSSSTPSLAGTVATATNGRSYNFDAAWRTPTGDDLAILQRQAAMVFPDGRLVNEPLRTALQKAATDRNIADNAAIDSAMCSLKILDGTASASASNVPNGTVKESSLVDARQIKAIHKLMVGTTPVDRAGNRLVDLSNPDQQKIAQAYKELTLQDALTPLNAGDPAPYNMPIEQRQPMEVRVTEIDLQLLRTTKIGAAVGSGVKDAQEYLLPNSGIIYASRDDALPDLSSVDVLDPKTGYRTFATMNKTLADKSSATDFKLDPTRRPNGIRLIRGANLTRQVNFREPEKGLTLVTNAPVYLKAENTNGVDGFNLHALPGTNNKIEEFTELVDPASNFYQRQTLNTNYACRPGLAGCAQGDQWRAARIIADSITLLSNNYYDGVRSDSNFDQNNNGGNYLVEPRLKNGFLWNGFGTSSKTANVTTPNSTNQSSYWTNGVTPIQRRASGITPYRMEICLKLPVVACRPQDWKQSHTVTIDGVTPTNLTIDAGSTSSLPTVTPSTPERLDSIYRLPRRVAFARNSDGSLLMTSNPADPNSDIILGSGIAADNTTKLVTIKKAADKGTIALSPLITTLTPTPIEGTGSDPVLWFGSGTQQSLSLKAPAATAPNSPLEFAPGAAPPTDFSPSPAGAYYQQYLPDPTTTAKKVALPQFLAPFDDGLISLIVTDPAVKTNLAEATKNTFCIATKPVVVAPATVADPVAPGAGASSQIVVRTQKSTGTLGYLAPKTLPENTGANLSTLPLPQTGDPMPAVAVKPFEPYAKEFGDPTAAALSPFNEAAWKDTPAGGATGSYGGIDPKGDSVKPCDTPVAEAIDSFKATLLAAAGDIVLSDFATPPATGATYVTLVPAVPPTSPATLTIKPVPPATAGARRVTYIDLGTSTVGLPIPAGTTITLQQGTEELADPNPIFVIRGLSDEGITIGDTTLVGDGVKLNLDGVSPNNVFWVSKRGITIADANATAAPTAAVPNPPFKGHLLAGNFIGRNTVDPAPATPVSSPLRIGDNTKVTAGRFLGFTTSNLREPRTIPIAPETAPTPPATLPGSVPPKVTMEIWAMNSLPPNYQKLTNQPIMAPVLNIHSPGGTPSNAFSTDTLDSSGWIPKASESTFNAVLVMGDSPSRPIEPEITQFAVGDESAESSGGLINFPRFLENWELATKVNIAGSLIQYKKSNYASAPFDSINNQSLDTSLFFDTPVYTNSLSFKGFRYPGGGNLFRAPYYVAPKRSWGYDVGLLNQSADLFSKRFSLPSAARPSEFFREVSRDDAWVKTLLCAKVATSGSPAVDAKQRPSGCI